MSPLQRFGRYLAKAFLNHWNLLAMGTGTALAAISGKPDVVLPLLVAGEVAYLSLLSTRPAFQKSVEALAQRDAEAPLAAGAEEKAQQMLAALSHDDRTRFERLRAQCGELRTIAIGLKTGAPVTGTPIAATQESGVNRLLWIYLKLLYSRATLQRFFDTMEPDEIDRDIARVQAQIDALGSPGEDTDLRARQRATLDDTLASCTARKSNLAKARENEQWIELEIQRLHTKIAGLAEMAINRQDPEMITLEVDGVSESVAQTEQTMTELELLNGVSGEGEVAPALMHK